MEASPVLAKIALAATYIQKAQVNEKGALSDKSLLLEAPHRCYVHVDYDDATGGVILAFAGHHSWHKWAHKFAHKRTAPEWAPDQEMKVNTRLAQIFDAYLHPQKRQLGLLEAMMFLSNGYLPRRVTCVGFGVGGALATVAACWAASKLATADVRCVSFGAPRVGNASFKVAFENLVGASYRVVLGADPAVHRPKKWFYRHVGHPVWLTHGTCKFQEVAVQHHDRGHEDESLEDYTAALQHLVEHETSTTDKEAENWAKQGSRGLGTRLQDGLHAAGDMASGAMHRVSDDKHRQEKGDDEGGAPALPDSIDMSNLSTRGIDDFELEEFEKEAPARGKARLNRIILAGKVAQATLLAQHAYEDAEAFRRNTGMTNARFLTYPKDDTQAFVAWLDGGTALFAFRGTESVKDVMVDLDARSAPVPVLSDAFPGARGHVGFMRQFASITDTDAPERHIGAVLDELSGQQAPTRVLCCGHSLGGALATLAAAWSAFRWPDADVRCVTLGSPRTGNAEFVHGVKYLVGGVHRLVYGWDPVPTVPPPGWFKHVKGRMFLHNDEAKFTKRPWYMSFGALTKASDHLTGPYIRNISSIVGKELAAENLGLITQDGGDMEAAPAAQDKPPGKPREARAKDAPKQEQKSGSKGCGCIG